MFTMPMGIYGRASGGGASYILPVVYYKFESQDGSDTSDAGNSFDFTLNGSPAFTGSVPTGGGSYSLVIDGVNDYGSTSDNTTIGSAIDGGYSVSAWINLSPTQFGNTIVPFWNIYDSGNGNANYRNVAQGTLYGHNSTTYGWGVSGMHRGTAGFSGVSVGFGGIDFSYGAGWSAATSWFHVVWTYDPTTDTHKQYGNGSLLRSGNPASGDPLIPTSAKFEIARNNTSTANQDFFVDELALWGQVLTADQVTTLYNSGEVIDNNTALEE